MRKINQLELVLVITTLLVLANGVEESIRIPVLRLSPELEMLQVHQLAATICTPFVDACNNDAICKIVFSGVCDHNQTINTIEPLLANQDKAIPPRLDGGAYVDGEVISVWQCWNLTAHYFMHVTPTASGPGSIFLSMNFCLVDNLPGFVYPWQEFRIMTNVFATSSAITAYSACRNQVGYAAQGQCVINLVNSIGDTHLLELYVRNHMVNLLQQLN